MRPLTRTRHPARRTRTPTSHSVLPSANRSIAIASYCIPRPPRRATVARRRPAPFKPSRSSYRRARYVQPTDPAYTFGYELLSPSSLLRLLLHCTCRAISLDCFFFFRSAEKYKKKIIIFTPIPGNGCTRPRYYRDNPSIIFSRNT